MMFGYWPMGGMMWGWVLVLFGCGYLFYMYRPRYHGYTRHRRYSRIDDPLDIAAARLARGEITIEEYERIRNAILGNGN